jgi:tRNA splicing endonuclease
MHELEEMRIMWEIFRGRRFQKREKFYRAFRQDGAHSGWYGCNLILYKRTKKEKKYYVFVEIFQVKFV